MSKRLGVSGVSLCLLAAIAAAPLLRAAEPPLPKKPLPLAGAPTRGSREAHVAVIEFADFQCPFCAAFARNTLPYLEQAYVETGKVVFAFRHFPLVEIHPRARRASVAADCAFRQGKFWEMHDALFTNQRALDEASLGARAEKVGLSRGLFDNCLNGLGEVRVRQDEKSGHDLNLTATPTFFIGAIQSDGTVRVSNRIDGAKSPDAFQAILDRLISGPE